ncbi:MAG: DUF2442 domain-containing protein [bacterium]
MSLTPGDAVDIVRAVYLGGYRLHLTFSDGHVTTVDFGPFLRASMQPQTVKYREESLFQKFAIVYGNLVWGDHEMCFSIEDLYGANIECPKEIDCGLAVAECRAEYTVARRKPRTK